MNDYFTDATYWLRRAATTLAANERDAAVDNIHDAVIDFAFGIEKLLKGILWNVNPLFIFETPSFENACGVLYRDKLLDNAREKAEKEDRKNQFEKNVIPFGASMKRAKVFSQVVATHMGMLTELAELRGLLAHRVVKEMDANETCGFLHRSFLPLAAAFSAELGVKFNEWQKADQEMLEKAHRDEMDRYNFNNRILALITKHKAIFAERQRDAIRMDQASRETHHALFVSRSTTLRNLPATCPVCNSKASLQVTLDEATPPEVELDGNGYITGLECKFCNFEIHDYEDMDYFAIQQFWQ
ncbi:MAG: hypothetical protein U0792_17955 [Gemmataceae bacterium]